MSDLGTRLKKLNRKLSVNAYAATRPQVQMARDHPLEFAAYILRDEQTREFVKIQEFQQEWAEAIDEHDRVVIITSPETGKTQIITIGYTIWEIGTYTDTARCALGSKTQELAGNRFLGPIMNYVATNERVREVFPHLARGRPWSVKGFMVRRGGRFDPVLDRTAIPIAPDANILGTRLTWVVFDDAIDRKNTFTEYQSDKVFEFIRLPVETRISKPRGSGLGRAGKAVFLTNAWEDYDAAHKLAEQEGWHLVVTPIARPETRTADHPYGITRWPNVWPQERVDSYSPATAPRVIHCRARGDRQRDFQSAWINKCKGIGEGFTLQGGLDKVPPGCGVVAGVDVATRRGKQHDSTAIFVALYGPPAAMGLDPVALGHGRRVIRPLWVETGRMTGPEIKDRLAKVHRRFAGVRFRVESNAAQVYLVDDLAIDEPGMRVRGSVTGANKHHPEHGVEGVAVEMSMGMWAIPCERDANGLLRCEPEVEAWIGEMLSYDRRAHTGDRLMASWLAREEAREAFEHEVGLMASGEEERAFLGEDGDHGGWDLDFFGANEEARRVARIAEARAVQRASLWGEIGVDAGDDTAGESDYDEADYYALD